MANWCVDLHFVRKKCEKVQIYVVGHKKMFCKSKKKYDLCCRYPENNLFTLKTNTY